MASNRPKGLSNNEFEGFRPEMVEFNICKLHDVRLIMATDRPRWTRDELRCWSRGFYRKGLEFLAAAKDEETRTEAIESVTAQDSTFNLRALKTVLLAGARAVRE